MGPPLGGFKLLCQHGLAVNGSHAEKCGEPHPENRAGAAGIQSRGAAGDIAGTNLCRNGGGQSLKRGHAVFTGFFTPQGKTAEKPAEAFAELSYLHKSGSDGEPNTGTHQQPQQQVVPYKVTDRADQCSKLIHIHSFPIPSHSCKQRKKPDPTKGSGSEKTKFMEKRYQNGTPLIDVFSTLSFCLRDFAECFLRCTFGSPFPDVLQSHIHLQSSSVTGRLRVLLLRQQKALLFLQTSFVTIF